MGVSRSRQYKSRQYNGQTIKRIFKAKTNNKQWYRKHYSEKQRLSNANITKIGGGGGGRITQVLRKCR